MTLKNINSKERGFTIVELLIVIVVIAILAAITLVAYNGVTARAKQSTAKSLAQSVQTKMEAYNAETGGYPITFTALNADSTKSYYIPTTISDATAPTSSTYSTNLTFYNCGASVGGALGYYDSTTSAIVYVYTGSAGGLSGNTSSAVAGTGCAVVTT